MDLSFRSKTSDSHLRQVSNNSLSSRLSDDFSHKHCLNEISLTKLLILTGKPLTPEDNLNFFSIKPLDEYKLNRSLTVGSRRGSMILNFDEIVNKLNDPKEVLRNKHKKYIITEENELKFAFDAFMAFINLYSVITTLFYLSFSPQKDYQLFADQIVWFFFIMDFLLNFFTEREDYHGHKLRNFSLIAGHYARRWMFFDFLALIPFSLFRNPNTEYGLRLTRIFKMHRMFDMVDMQYFSNKIAKLVSGGEERRRKYISIMLLNTWDLFRVLVAMIFASYCLACLWYFYINLIIRRFNEPKTFFETFDLLKDSPLNQLIKTWYFIFSTLTTTGSGDFIPTNKYEMMLCLTICIAGPTWFAFMSSKILNIVKSLRGLTGFSNNSADLAMWISSLEKKHRRIPYKFKQKINNFFLYYWRNDRLGSLALFESENELFEITDDYLPRMPEKIKFEILDFLFHDLFYMFSYFFGRNSKWKYEMCLYLQPRFFNKQQIILEFDEEIKEILFMTIGEFEMMIMHNGEPRKICCQERNSIIGDYFIFKGIKSFLRYQATETVHCFAVPSAVLKKLVGIHKEHFSLYFKAVVSNIECLLDAFPKTLENQDMQTRPILQSLDRKKSILTLQENEYPEKDLINIVIRMKNTRTGSMKILQQRLVQLCNKIRLGNKQY